MNEFVQDKSFMYDTQKVKIKRLQELRGKLSDEQTSIFITSVDVIGRE